MHPRNERFESFQIPVFHMDEVWYSPLNIEFKNANVDDDITHVIMIIVNFIHLTFYNFVFQVTLRIQVITFCMNNDIYY